VSKEERKEWQGQTRAMMKGEEQLMSRVVKVALLAALMLALSAGVALAATIVGTENDDSIDGTGDSDQIFVLEGDDFVDAFGGDDEVYGNEDDDFLIGAEDSDKVFGNTGKDEVDLESFDTSGSTDEGFGGAQNDTVFAQDGNFDAIDCGPGTRDTVFLDRGLDTRTRCESVNPAGVASEPPAAQR
jgi:RTX calcium-binding nonapeptide repeat (4 copies)